MYVKTRNYRTHLKPLLDKFTEWLDHHQYLTKAKLGKAIICARKMLPSLYLLLDHAGLSISNNSAERAMRIPTLGRKNWLFSQSIKGAIANGLFLNGHPNSYSKRFGSAKISGVFNRQVS